MMNEHDVNVLIDRIASNAESTGTFTEFATAAAGSSAQWERLARTLRDELQMRSAMEEALTAGARAEIEVALRRGRETTSATRTQLSGWSGWAVAATIALAWSVGLILPRAGGSPEEAHPQPVQLAALTADEALEQYFQTAEREGRIVAELPAVLVETHQTDEGFLEVYYLRQWLEREEVAHLYEMAQDEHGRDIPVQIDAARLLTSPSSL